MSWLDIFSYVRDYLFPPICLVCGSRETYRREHLICEACIDSISLIRHPFCIHCGKPFLTESDRDHLCGDCLTQKSYLTIVRALGKYEGVLQKLIHQFKYKQQFAVSNILEFLLDGYQKKDINFCSYNFSVPVPLHRSRLRQRGFNQSVLWGKILEKKYNLPLKRMVLQRIVCTPPQIALRGKERKNNVRNAFKVKNSELVNGKTILLLDDVYTTGATMNECARVLKKAGAFRVDGFVIARAG